jgi:two-component system CheB/CheR fusion protein
MDTISKAKNLESLHKAKNIEISYDPTNKFLYCNWLGFQNKESIMKSGAVILDLLKQKRAEKVLNDNSQVTGPWQDAADWTAKEWFPNMIKSGLKHFAWIFSPNIFSELSAKKAMPANEFIKSFNSLEDAERWLKAQN